MNLGNLSQVFSLDQMSLCRLSSHGFYRRTGKIREEINERKSGSKIKDLQVETHTNLNNNTEFLSKYSQNQHSVESIPPNSTLFSLFVTQ